MVIEHYGIFAYHLLSSMKTISLVRLTEERNMELVTEKKIIIVCFDLSESYLMEECRISLVSPTSDYCFWNVKNTIYNLEKIFSNLIFHKCLVDSTYQEPLQLKNKAILYWLHGMILNMAPLFHYL